jgi:disulfide bond formation protein DsbB
MKSYSLYLAWLIACVSTIGSLYFSEVLHLEPCHLCWYQRICIFPLSLILGLAVYRNFHGIVLYVLPLVVIGFLFAVYQIVLQETGYNPIEMCGAGPSCSDKVDIGLGFITMPMLSALALFCMGVLLLIAKDSRETAASPMG